MVYKKLLCVGPGGVKCHCCFPAPSSKARKAAFRRAKRIDKREVLKEHKRLIDEWQRNA